VYLLADYFHEVGQGHTYSQPRGDLVFLATFSDKSTAIFNVVFP
jgi:hypothetical protein